MQWRLQMKDTKHRWRLRYFVSTPFILLPLIPTVFFDVTVQIYHHICFRLYDIPLVDRSKYIVFDRAKLPYLAWYEKLFCLYCSYVNGVVAYVGKVAGDTEDYWCGIKHKSFPGYVEAPHQAHYVAYGDEKAFHERYG